jgi:short-subunit dehydrogenase
VAVTGSSAGFGKILATSFLRQGAKVVLTGRDPDRLRQAVLDLEGVGRDVVGQPADVTRSDNVAELFEFVHNRHGRLDVLVNNVGRSDRGLAIETSIERFRELWEENFLTAVRCTQAAMAKLIESQGHVVFIGSLAAKSASRFLGAYPASKFPLAAFAQQLRLEIGPQGVHILLVCPGPIARPDAGARYDELTRDLPDAARLPGGGVKVAKLDPQRLAEAILRACERRSPELVMPARARWLFAISQLWPALGDWILRR